VKALLPAFRPISFFTYSSTLKMQATCSSETSVYCQRTTRRHIPEDRNLHNHRCGNLKSYTRQECFFRTLKYAWRDWVGRREIFGTVLSSRNSDYKSPEHRFKAELF
jgi:hypothetical protein